MENTSHPFPIKYLLIASVAIALTGGLWLSFRTTVPVAEPVGINQIVTGGSTALSLSPAVITTSVNTETSVSLMANSGSEKLSVVKFELSYDPTKLQVSTLTKGSWLTQVLGTLTVSSGKITGTLGAHPTANGGAELNRTGTGTLLTFTVKPLVSGSNSISFVNAPTEAYTVTNNTNTLKSVSGTTITTKLKADLVGTDRKVDIYDFSEFLAQYNHPGTADFNKSGTVDIADYSYFISEYGKTW